MSDYTLNVLKMKSKKYEDYVNCINPDYNRNEELAYEVITRFNEYEKEIQELKEKVKELVKYAYGTEMSLGEFKEFYKLATGKEYEPKKCLEVK